ncbi:MAG TPA: hypothetical protein VER37_01090 [Thermomicrobiales bacterium]|nr:hypothetical protein [Thermomicrobiales bacterium]
MAQERDRHGTAFVVGAALGGVVGAVWGLLNAAETGEQARAGLGRRLDAGADRLVLAAADFEVTARQWLARRDLAPRGGEAPEFALPDNHEAADPPVAVGGVLPEVEGGGGPDEVIG